MPNGANLVSNNHNCIVMQNQGEDWRRWCWQQI